MTIRLFRILLPAFLALSLGVDARAQNKLPKLKTVPRMQAMPMPYDQISFQREGMEIARYHFGPNLHRTFLYPLIGPAGRSLTRMRHPRDPQSHSHHNSVWISHNSVGGVDFWSDQGQGRVVHREILQIEDGDEETFILVKNEWVGNEDKVLLEETRRIAVDWMENREWMLILDLSFAAKNETITLGETPFGMIGVRMAKTIGVNDGGGTIRNSEGQTDEQEIFRKPAKWVDYSGAIANTAIEGITLFDHPSNPTFPSKFHVRNDGWMGICLNLDGAIDIKPSEPLRLRYGLYIHSDLKPRDAIDEQWKRFTDKPLSAMEKTSP